MTPLHELLSRIRWDPEFGRGRFEIAYVDRCAAGLVRIALDHIAWSGAAAFAFDAHLEDGSVQSVPFHRVREVRRDGKLIWGRLRPATVRPSRPVPRTPKRLTRPTTMRRRP